MDVDKGKAILVEPNSGIARSDPGTSQPTAQKPEAISAEGTDDPMQGGLSDDVVMAISDFVDAISANPGTIQSNPGTAPLRPEEIFTIHETPSWVQPIRAYLVEGTLPEEEASARKIHRKSKSYTIINGETYRRSVTGVLQRCVEPAEGQEILTDIHQGECGHHVSSRALVAKAFRHGFYWPTALDDAENIVRKCNGCQRFSRQTHVPLPVLWRSSTPQNGGLCAPAVYPPRFLRARFHQYVFS